MQGRRVGRDLPASGLGCENGPAGRAVFSRSLCAPDPQLSSAWAWGEDRTLSRTQRLAGAELVWGPLHGRVAESEVGGRLLPPGLAPAGQVGRGMAPYSLLQSDWGPERAAQRRHCCSKH